MRFLFPSSECSTSGWRGWMLGCCCCCCTGVCTGSVPCCTHVSAQPKKKNVMCTAARLDGSFPPRLEVPNDNTPHCSRLAAFGVFFCALLSTDSDGFRNDWSEISDDLISWLGEMSLFLSDANPYGVMNWTNQFLLWIANKETKPDWVKETDATQKFVSSSLVRSKIDRSV